MRQNAVIPKKDKVRNTDDKLFEEKNVRFLFFNEGKQILKVWQLDKILIIQAEVAYQIVQLDVTFV